MKVLVPYSKETQLDAERMAKLLREQKVEPELLEIDFAKQGEAGKEALRASLARCDAVAIYSPTDGSVLLPAEVEAIAADMSRPRLLLTEVLSTNTSADHRRSQHIQLEYRIEGANTEDRLALQQLGTELERATSNVARLSNGEASDAIAEEGIGGTPAPGHESFGGPGGPSRNPDSRGVQIPATPTTVLRTLTTGDCRQQWKTARSGGKVHISEVDVTSFDLDEARTGRNSSRRMLVTQFVKWGPVILAGSSLLAAAFGWRRLQPALFDDLPHKILEFIKYGSMMAPVGTLRSTVPEAREGLINGVATAFAPRRALIGESFMAQIYLVIPTEEDMHIARERAINKDPDAINLDQALLIDSIPRGALISVAAKSRTFRVDGTPKMIRWFGQVSQQHFEVEVVDGFGTGNRFIYFDIKIGTKLVATLTAQILVETGKTGPEVEYQPQINVVFVKRYQHRFLSYSGKDWIKADAIRAGYERQNLKIFYDADAESLRRGEAWKHKLAQELEKFDCFVLCWSGNAKASDWVKEEATHFVRRRNLRMAGGVDPLGFELHELEPNPPEPWPDLPELMDYQFTSYKSSNRKKTPSVSVAFTKPFRDQSFTPEIVVVPSGVFTMGSGPKEIGRRRDEGPQRDIRIDVPFAVGRDPVTFDDWERAREAGFSLPVPDDKGWGRGRRPLINVSWIEAKGYSEWLAQQTKRNYRLLSESEWEYVCRATQKVGVGKERGKDDLARREIDGNFDRSYSTNASERSAISAGKTSEVDDDRTPNAFGVRNMLGNVWEWVEDCYHASYEGRPIDGTAWVETPRRRRRVVRGGSFASGANYVRYASRGSSPIRPARPSTVGFRVARDLTFDELEALREQG